MKEKATNRKEWAFFVGMILFALGFWAQPILIALNKSNVLIGTIGIVSIGGLVMAILMVEPKKAKLRKFYPLAFAGIIILEMVLQVVVKKFFQ